MLSISALFLGKPQNDRGGGTKSEFWETPSDPKILEPMAAALGKTLQRLELNTPHIPAAEYKFLLEFPHLVELVIHGQCNLHLNVPAFPPLPNLTRLECNVRPNSEAAFLDNLKSMKNLTYLTLGSDWMSPELVTFLGTHLLQLKTIQLEGGTAEVIDAFARTPLSATIESILSYTIWAEWLMQHLLAPGDQMRFPLLRHARIHPPKKARTRI